MREQKGNAAALLPIGIFLVIFLGSGIVTGDFYAMPAIVRISDRFAGRIFAAPGTGIPGKDRDHIQRRRR